jgi:hypothetical protein
MTAKTWGEALRDGAISGAIAGVATAGVAALCGWRDSGSAIAPINATSHVVHGDEAGSVTGLDLAHTGIGFPVHMGSAMLWATLYERAFGAAADRGETGKALAGGYAIAALAYLTDYHAMPKRLTPGWEERVSGPSLALIFGALALSLPLRGLLRDRAGSSAASSRYESQHG